MRFNTFCTLTLWKLMIHNRFWLEGFINLTFRLDAIYNFTNIKRYWIVIPIIYYLISFLVFSYLQIKECITFPWRIYKKNNIYVSKLASSLSYYLIDINHIYCLCNGPQFIIFSVWILNNIRLRISCVLNCWVSIFPNNYKLVSKAIIF